MKFLLPFLVAAALPAQEVPKVGVIEYYGVHKTSHDRLVKALGVKPGDPMPASKGGVEERLEEVAGVVRARLTAVCCSKGEAILFVGIEEKGAPHFEFRDPPAGDAELPREILDTWERFQSALEDAVRRDRRDEDLREGHSLMADAAARTLQERFVMMAEAQQKILQEVLRTSANEEHRAIAAYVIQYVPRKREVVDDLLLAMQDPDDAVRNNAMRSLSALSVLANRDPESGVKISPTWMVEMVNSVIWTDRNKAVMNLLNLTEDRNPRVLEQVRDRALASLADMARWSTLEYAIGPYTLLGRVAGLPETRIHEAWEKGDREVVIGMALRPPKKDKN